MSRASTYSTAKFGGYFAVSGGVALIPPVVWNSFFASGAYEPLSVVFTTIGFLGTFLTTASVLWLYAVISSEGEAKGLLWALLGVAVTLLALVGLAFYAIETLRGEESVRLYLSASVISWWIRPLAIVLFAFALVRADILFGRALLLFLIAFLEIPLLSSLILEIAQSAGWGTLAFGFPGLQTGLVGAVLWISFGYSLLLLDEPEPSDSSTYEDQEFSRA